MAIQSVYAVLCIAARRLQLGPGEDLWSGRSGCSRWDQHVCQDPLLLGVCLPDSTLVSNWSIVRCIKRHFGSAVRFSVAALFPSMTTMLSGFSVHLLLHFVHNMCQKTFDRFVQQLSAYALVVLVCLAFMGWIMWRMEQTAWRALIQIRGDGGTAKQD